MIIQNALRITETICGKKVETFLLSKDRHDFQKYEFQDKTYIFTDGGNDYIRRGGNFVSDSERVIDWSLDDNSSLSTIKEKLLWGTRGKSGKEPLKYVPLNECETSHLQAILDTQIISPLYQTIIKMILDERVLR